MKDDPDDRIRTLEHRLDVMVKASVEAWQALGYGPGATPPYTLAEAIRRKLRDDKK